MAQHSLTCITPVFDCRLLVFIVQGQVFGEMGLFLGARRSLTAMAADYVELLELGHEAFAELRKVHPQVPTALSCPSWYIMQFQINRLPFITTNYNYYFEFKTL